ncbi:MAG: DUF6935 domain-containing protein [Promethearchaeota archaeon]
MNFAEINELWKSRCRGEPESAIEIYILGVLLYEINENEGEAACSLALHKNLTIIDEKKHSIEIRLNQKEKQNLEILKRKPYIIRSYIKDPNNPKLFLRKKEVARSRAKILIKSNLKSPPTSILLIKDEAGYWKIVEGTYSLIEGIE